MKRLGGSSVADAAEVNEGERSASTTNPSESAGRDAINRSADELDPTARNGHDRGMRHDPDCVAALTLSMLPGAGPKAIRRLLDRFGSPSGVLAASGPELAQVERVGPQLIHAIRTAPHHVDAESIVAWCRKSGVAIVREGHRGYPTRLVDLDTPPPILFVRGEISAADELAVAIVGTRHPTPYGLRQAERFAFGLAKAGVTVISGLARGIDAATHEAALGAGGRTIAVLGSGLGQIYPAEHAGLAATIGGSGAVVSEFPPDAKPRAGMFPRRNRVIAGLSLATLVIEAPDRSGSLITARLAGEQGRAVLALPGPVNGRASRGCHALIRDGATLVRSVDDVLEAIGPIGNTIDTDFGTCDSSDGVAGQAGGGHDVRSGVELTLNDLERQVLHAIDTAATPIDHVIDRSGLPAHRVLATVSVLEMRHLVRRLSGQYVARI